MKVVRFTMNHIIYKPSVLFFRLFKNNQQNLKYALSNSHLKLNLIKCITFPTNIFTYTQVQYLNYFIVKIYFVSGLNMIAAAIILFSGTHIKGM